MKLPEATNTIFTYPVDRLLEMRPGQIISYPLEDYSKVNARRQRAEKKTGGKFSLRKVGGTLHVWRRQ